MDDRSGATTVGKLSGTDLAFPLCWPFVSLRVDEGDLALDQQRPVFRFRDLHPTHIAPDLVFGP